MRYTRGVGNCTDGAWLSLARAPGSGPGGRWFESTRPDQLNLLQSHLVESPFTECYSHRAPGAVPNFVPTLGFLLHSLARALQSLLCSAVHFLPGSLHRLASRIVLWVDVPHCRCHVAVAGQSHERPRVHVRCPSCETGMTERVQIEVFKLNGLQGVLRTQQLGGSFEGRGVLLAQTRFLDVAAPGSRCRRPQCSQDAAENTPPV